MWLQGARDEQKLLRQVAARQERELDRFTGSDGELPAIQSAHTHEMAALKDKLKKVDKLLDYLNDLSSDPGVQQAAEQSGEGEGCSGEHTFLDTCHLCCRRFAIGSRTRS